jgi:hypothetical protein
MIRKKREPKYRIIDYPYFKAIKGGKLTGSQYAVLLEIIDQTFGYREDKKPRLSCEVSLTDFQEGTKLDRTQVIRAIRALENMLIIIVDRSGGTRGTVYTWNTPEKWQLVNHTSPVTSGTGVTSTSGIRDTQLVAQMHKTSGITTPATSLLKKESKRKKDKVKDSPSPSTDDVSSRDTLLAGVKGQTSVSASRPGPLAKWVEMTSYSQDALIRLYAKTHGLDVSSGTSSIDYDAVIDAVNQHGVTKVFRELEKSGKLPGEGKHG